MTDSSCLWSEMVRFPANQDPVVMKAWAQDVLSLDLSGLNELEIGDEQEAAVADWARMLGQHGVSLRDVEEDSYYSWPEFDFSFEPEGIWIYSEESSNLDHVAAFVRGFLLKFDPTRCFQLQWANICSKPRVGEFGGGAMLITATDTIRMTTGEILESLLEDQFTGMKSNNNPEAEQGGSA